MGVGVPPKSPDCWSSCNVREKMGEGGMEDDSGIVIKDVCEGGMQSLGGGAGVDAHEGRYFVW